MKQMSQMKLIVCVVVLGVLCAATAQAACTDQVQCDACKKEKGCTWFAYGLEATMYLLPQPLSTKIPSGVGRCVEAKCDNCKFSGLDSLLTFKTKGVISGKPFVAKLPDAEACPVKLDTPKIAYEKQTCNDCVKSGNEWCQFDADVKLSPPQPTTTTTKSTTKSTTKKVAGEVVEAPASTAAPASVEFKTSGGVCLPKGSASCKPELLMEIPGWTFKASAKNKCSAAFSKYHIVGSSLMAVVMVLYIAL